ncbi:MAG: hypothetical protein WCS97_00005 [Candidatus Paceibacterota bacterium]
MTEVYKVDDDGRKSKSLGFFKDKTVAEAFAGNQVDVNWHKTATALVLTDGKEGYVIEEQKSVKLFDDETETFELRKLAVAKLSAADRNILGLGD